MRDSSGTQMASTCDSMGMPTHMGISTHTTHTRFKKNGTFSLSWSKNPYTFEIFKDVRGSSGDLGHPTLPNLVSEEDFLDDQDWHTGISIIKGDWLTK